MAGAIAYYALLSLVPLTILAVIALSHLIAQDELMAALAQYLEWLVPSQSAAVLADVSAFLENRIAIGVILLATMLFFSSVAFSVLADALRTIFAHRGDTEDRHPMVSALLPYSFVFLLGLALLVLTAGSIALQSMASGSVTAFGRTWSLDGLSGILLYLLGMGVETVILGLVYLVMPVGRTHPKHALAGGLTAASLWEVVRHVLIWYFATLSKASIVYGSLTTAVVALLSLEAAAALLLLGAEVIAAYEQIGRRPAPRFP